MHIHHIRNAEMSRMIQLLTTLPTLLLSAGDVALLLIPRIQTRPAAARSVGAGDVELLLILILMRLARPVGVGDVELLLILILMRPARPVGVGDVELLLILMRPARPAAARPVGAGLTARTRIVHHANGLIFISEINYLYR